MELFYTSPENITLDAARLVIDGDEFHHLARVLRKKTGDQILVTDGQGSRCEVRIGDIGKKSLEGGVGNILAEEFYWLCQACCNRAVGAVSERASLTFFMVE